MPRGRRPAARTLRVQGSTFTLQRRQAMSMHRWPWASGTASVGGRRSNATQRCCTTSRSRSEWSRWGAHQVRRAALIKCACRLRRSKAGGDRARRWSSTTCILPTWAMLERRPPSASFSTSAGTASSATTRARCSTSAARLRRAMQTRPRTLDTCMRTDWVPRRTTPRRSNSSGRRWRRMITPSLSMGLATCTSPDTACRKTPRRR
mmetsp:Transcript_6673/g.27221  ORF Transcript_6673/g.27221 Transcript_6673/m.27221 type:complete len:206 (+) Transcript_6673:424-1041(+)